MERIGNVNVTSVSNLSNVNVNEWVESQRQKAKQRSQDNLANAKKLQKGTRCS